jgi:hypothetical protein
VKTNALATDLKKTSNPNLDHPPFAAILPLCGRATTSMPNPSLALRLSCRKRLVSGWGSYSPAELKAILASSVIAFRAQRKSEIVCDDTTAASREVIGPAGCIIARKNRRLDGYAREDRECVEARAWDLIHGIVRNCKIFQN